MVITRKTIKKKKVVNECVHVDSILLKTQQSNLKKKSVIANRVKSPS